MSRIKLLHMTKSILSLFIIGFLIMNIKTVQATEAKDNEVKDHMLYLNRNTITEQEQETITNTKELYQVTLLAPEVSFFGMPTFNTIKELYIAKGVKNILIDGYRSTLQEIFPNLEAIYVEDANLFYQSIDGVLYSKDGTKLISYPMKKGNNAIVEKGTKVIASNAFSFVPLSYIEIPDGLICLEKFAFRSSTLKEILLPKSFRQLQPDTFDQSELTSITVSSENPYFVSVDGILYRQDKRFLEYWPEKKQVEEYILPQGMEVLDGAKIKNIQTLKTLTIPQSVMSCINMSKNQLVSIQVDSNHPYLALFDGVLYSIDYKIIYVYPNQNQKTVIKIHDNLEIFPMELFDTINTTKALKLPKNLKVMDGYRYEGLLGGFRNLSVLELEKSNSYYTVKDGILFDKAMTKIIWFPINLEIKSYTIPESVTLIDNGQLRSQNYLQQLYVHKNCQLVHDRDSYYEEFLYDIPFGKECFALEAVVIEEGNPYFKSIDGVVFDAVEHVLYLYPCAKKEKKYQIPDKIYAADFNTYNPYLEEIIFSKELGGLFGVSFNEEVYGSKGEGKVFQRFTNLKCIKSNGNTNFEMRNNDLYRVDSWSNELKIYSFDTDYSAKVKEYLDTYWVTNNDLMVDLHFSLESQEENQEKELVEGYVFSKDNTRKYQKENVVTIQDISSFTSFPYDTIYENVEKVIIAEGITSLPQYIFHYFPNVNAISLPRSLREIDKTFYFEDYYVMLKSLYAGEIFPYYLSYLEEVRVHPQNSYYTAVDGILYNREMTNLICYPPKKLRSTYVMPNSLTSIETFAFGVNDRLQRIVINALYQINSEYNELYSKGYLPKLTAIEVDEENLYLHAEDGILYNKGMTALLEYPKGRIAKSYHIPETVTSIGNRVFYGASIEKLMFPKTCQKKYLNLYYLSYSKIGTILDNGYTNFRVIDGVIYDKELKYLLYWPTHKRVKHLKFPSTLQYIHGSISNLEYVEYITIPKDLKSFYGTSMQMKNLKKIYLEDGNEYFTLYDGILYNKALTNLYLMPNSSSKTTIRVPANLKGCYNRATQNEMRHVTKIIIEGSGLYFPYENLPELKEFELAKGNNKASVVDGVLYNASKSTLIWYPQNQKTKAFTVPSSVTSFRKNTFEVHHYLETITLSEKLSLKYDYDTTWFSNCKKLKEIKVSSRNPYIMTVDGVLYTKDKKTLLVYPMGKEEKEYTVLESAEKVYLNQNGYLIKLKIGTNVASIECRYEYQELQGFTALEAIVVSDKNKSYYSKEGVVYHSTRYGDELIFYPAAKKEKVFFAPSNIVYFYYHNQLKNHRYLKNIYTNSDRFKAYGTNLVEIELG